jgi:hypothetical protein
MIAVFQPAQPVMACAAFQTANHIGTATDGGFAIGADNLAHTLNYNASQN